MIQRVRFPEKSEIVRIRPVMYSSGKFVGTLAGMEVMGGMGNNGTDAGSGGSACTGGFARLNRGSRKIKIRIKIMIDWKIQTR